VPSNTLQRGLAYGEIVPAASASRIICNAIRSLMDPPGLRNSHLAQISIPVKSLRQLIRSKGVFPINCVRLLATTFVSRLSVCPRRNLGCRSSALRFDRKGRIKTHSSTIVPIPAARITPSKVFDDPGKKRELMI